MMIVDCLDDEDEVLEVLASQLGSLVEFIGGKEFLPLLLPALEVLGGAEQSKVRDRVCAPYLSSFCVPGQDPSRLHKCAV